jgi:hypothetical protein
MLPGGDNRRSISDRYVRLLPPLDHTVSPPRPPTADDCVTYTFYLDKSDQPGCR